MTCNQEPLTEALDAIIRRFAPNNKLEIRFTPQTHLVHDVGIDSLRMVDIVLEIEEAFGFAIEDEDSHRVQTFADLVNLVQGSLQTAVPGDPEAVTAMGEVAPGGGNV
jgi:acyl carrier protein